MIEIRPEVPQTLFGLLSICLLLRYFQSKSLKYLVFSSIFLGISFLFLQKSIFLILIIGCLLLFRWGSNQIKFKDTFLYFLVLITVLMSYYVYLIFNHKEQDFLICCWSQDIEMLQYNTLSGWGVTPILGLISSFKHNPILWFFWLISLPFMETPNQERIAGISLFLLCFICASVVFHTQDLMLIIPLIAVMAGHMIYKLNILFFKLKPFLFCLILIFFTFLFIYLNLENINPSLNAKQLKKIKYVLSITKPTDYVYDGNNSFNLFRNDLDFFWFQRDYLITLSWGIHKVNSHYNMYELINKFKPKVISTFQIKNIRDKSIANHYKKSDVYSNIFIRID